jgi:hypothetical protein
VNLSLRRPSTSAHSAQAATRRQTARLTLLFGYARWSFCPLSRPRKSNDIRLDNDPEKWIAVFRSDDAPPKIKVAMTIQTQGHRARAFAQRQDGVTGK